MTAPGEGGPRLTLARVIGWSTAGALILSGYFAGGWFAEDQAQGDLQAAAAAGHRGAAPKPTGDTPDPFVSAMPRMIAKVRPGNPVRIVGPAFRPGPDADVVAHEMPFAFRTPGEWTYVIDQTHPDRVYRSVAGPGPGHISKRFHAMLALRRCDGCGRATMDRFDKQWMTYYLDGTVKLRRHDDRTWYRETSDKGRYTLVVRRKFKGQDGKGYLLGYAVDAPAAKRKDAQALANEIATQTPV